MEDAFSRMYGDASHIFMHPNPNARVRYGMNFTVVILEHIHRKFLVNKPGPIVRPRPAKRTRINLRHPRRRLKLSLAHLFAPDFSTSTLTIELGRVKEPSAHEHFRPPSKAASPAITDTAMNNGRPHGPTIVLHVHLP